MNETTLGRQFDGEQAVDMCQRCGQPMHFVSGEIPSWECYCGHIAWIPIDELALVPPLPEKGSVGILADQDSDHTLEVAS